MWITIGIVAIVAFLLVLIVNGAYRVTVNPNEVHIVQSAKKSVAYGQGFPDKVYYKWPSWFPVIGCVVSKLPISVFDITIEDYQAYDIGRVPFGIDVKAFFRISDPILASSRIENFEQMHAQLHDVLKSSIRSILAGSDIEDILQGRSEFSTKFTDAVREQLNKDWGVEVVKNIEFMEIRDGANSQVITNIQKKKESEILKHSRIAISMNNKEASVQETINKQESDMKQQEALEAVGVRTVTKDKNLQLESQKAQQVVQEEQKKTREKEMEVLKVQEVKNAEINKEKEIITADKEARKKVINSEAELAKSKNDAEGIKVNAEAESNRITALGKAEGDATTAKEVALIAGKVELMVKMKENPEYQKYLQIIESILAGKEVGVAQAKALEHATIKFLGTDGKVNPAGSLKDILTPTGLSEFGMALDGFGDMSEGKSLMDVIGMFQKLPKEKQEEIVETIKTNAGKVTGNMVPVTRK